MGFNAILTPDGAPEPLLKTCAALARFSSALICAA
jgi:hypothetical protein